MCRFWILSALDVPLRQEQPSRFQKRYKWDFDVRFLRQGKYKESWKSAWKWKTDLWDGIFTQLRLIDLISYLSLAKTPRLIFGRRHLFKLKRKGLSSQGRSATTSGLDYERSQLAPPKKKKSVYCFSPIFQVIRPVLLELFWWESGGSGQIQSNLRSMRATIGQPLTLD